MSEEIKHLKQVIEEIGDIAYIKFIENIESEIEQLQCKVKELERTILILEQFNKDIIDARDRFLSEKFILLEQNSQLKEELKRLK